MRAAQILAAVPDLPAEIQAAIYDLDARAYRSNSPVRLSEAQVYLRLRAAIRTSGSEAAFARRIGISRQSLSDITNAKRAMSGRVLAAIGLREVKARTYAPID